MSRVRFSSHIPAKDTHARTPLKQAGFRSLREDVGQWAAESKAVTPGPQPPRSRTSPDPQDEPAPPVVTPRALRPALAPTPRAPCGLGFATPGQAQGQGPTLRLSPWPSGGCWRSCWLGQSPDPLSWRGSPSAVLLPRPLSREEPLNPDPDPQL